MSFTNNLSIVGDSAYYIVGSDNSLSAVSFAYDDSITMAVAITPVWNYISIAVFHDWWQTGTREQAMARWEPRIPVCRFRRRVWLGENVEGDEVIRQPCSTATCHSLMDLISGYGQVTHRLCKMLSWREIFEERRDMSIIDAIYCISESIVRKHWHWLVHWVSFLRDIASGNSIASGCSPNCVTSAINIRVQTDALA